MTSIDQLLRGCGLPALEAQVLYAFAAGQRREWVVARRPDPPQPEHTQAFQQLVARRLGGEPLAYIMGEREFYGRTFAVTPDVLIPRPETEHLVEQALQCSQTLPHQSPPIRVLDIGTGSGIIAITLALEFARRKIAAQVTACDISPAALTIAQHNALLLGASVQFAHSDVYDAFASNHRFELIVSNPPYIAAGDSHLTQGDLRFEPSQALTDAADGLRIIRRIVQAAPTRLAAGGWCLMEHGYDQGPACRQLLAQNGAQQVRTVLDLSGIERVSLGQFNN